jgi:deoxycytidylate deaminase
MGLNGVPRGFPHCGTGLDVSDARLELLLPVLCQGINDPKGDTRRCMAVHAEINALLTCTDLRYAATMYVSATPCRNCALAIANTNIKRVVCLEVYADDARHILAAADIALVVNPNHVG